MKSGDADALADKVPTAIHEQNAVLGRVNRLLARRVTAIATAYPDVTRMPPRSADKVSLVGNPVREEVLRLRDQPFPPITDDGVFRLLVTGGSQGATVLSLPQGRVNGRSCGKRPIARHRAAGRERASKRRSGLLCPILKSAVRSYNMRMSSISDHLMIG